MTQVHFTLKQEEIQKLIEGSVKDDLSKNILTTVFNQLMEEQRNQYIGVGAYERDEIVYPQEMDIMTESTQLALVALLCVFLLPEMAYFLQTSSIVIKDMKKHF